MAALTVHQSTPGTDFETLVAEYNALATAMNALLAKLDADPTIAATDWASTVGTMDTVVLGY